MNITPQEFERYTKGEASTSEKAKIEQWLGEQHGELPEAKGETAQLDLAWKRLAIEAAKVADEPKLGKAAPLWKSQHNLFWKVAACLIVAIGIGWYLSKDSPLNTEHRIIANKTVRTLAGQRKEIILPDGTKVILNAASELNYPETFTSDNRLVKLNGEALFDVAHDEDKPFIIHTESSYTRVLGTKFNLSAYNNDEKVTLTVVRGKVRFGRFDENDQVILTLGMQGVITPHQKVSADKVAVDETQGWQHNVLQLNNQPLSDVAKQLERWYGVSVQLSSEKLKQTTVTGTYEQASLEDILNSLSFTTGFKYQINNKNVTLSE